MNTNNQNILKFSFSQKPLVLALRKAFSSQIIPSSKPLHKQEAALDDNKIRFESLEPRILLSADLIPADPLNLSADQAASYAHEVVLAAPAPTINLNMGVGPSPATSVAAPTNALTFEASRGQTNDQLAFVAKGPDLTLSLTGDGAVLQSYGGATVSMDFIGANPTPVITGLETLPGIDDHLADTDPNIKATGGVNYRSVFYDEVYQGIDLVFYGKSGAFEYDWIVAAGARPDEINVAFSGITGLEIEADGDLLLHTVAEDLIQKAPLLYQNVGGQRQIVDGRFVLRGHDAKGFEVGFEVGAYDHSLELVIDPVLGYSTYLGGTGNDTSRDVATDAEGNTYVIGTTGSKIIAGQDAGTYTGAFITKFKPDGQIAYIKTLGPAGRNDVNGIAFSIGEAVAIGPDGLPYVVFTSLESDSLTFVTTYQLHISKLDAEGVPIFDTELLASLPDDPTPRAPFGHKPPYFVAVGGFAVDDIGSSYITFEVIRPIKAADGGNSFPDTDVFITKVNSDGEIDFTQPLSVFPRAIAVDAEHNIYLTASTDQQGMPVSANAIQPQRTASPYGPDVYYNIPDVYVAMLDPTATGLLAGTYLGGENFDYAGGIAVNPNQPGVVYLAGATSSPDFPLKNPFQKQLNNSVADDGRGIFDGFITKLDLVNMELLASTFLGGGSRGGSGLFGQDVLSDIALDQAGHVYVVGHTTSLDFPMANPLLTTYTPGPTFDLGGSPYVAPFYDFVIAKFDASLSTLEFSTYFGGSGQESATNLLDPRSTGTWDGPRVAVDLAGTIHVAGTSAGEALTFNGPPVVATDDFPVLNAVQPTFGGGISSYGSFDVASDLVVLTINQRGALLGLGVRANQGSEISPIVANFANPRLNSSPSDFEATIDWGDGTQSLGLVEPNRTGNAFYRVSGTHTYDKPGAYPVVVSVRDRVNETMSPQINQDLSNRKGSQIAPAMAQDPTFLRRLVAVSTTEPPLLGDAGPGIALAISENGGGSWAPRLIADGRDTLPAAQGSPDVLFDSFGNLYIAYLSEGGDKVVLLSSKDGGNTFGDAPLKEFSGAGLSSAMSRPRLVWNAARNEIWLTVMDTAIGELTVAAAVVTGLGEIDGFVERTVRAGDGAGAADIAAGPDGGVAIVWEQEQASGGMQLKVLLDEDGLGDHLPLPIRDVLTCNGTGPVTIPTLSEVQLGLGPVLAWDNSTGPYRGRLYVSYQDLALNGSAIVDGNLDAYLSWTDDGITWAEPIQIADDSAGQQFLPTVAVDQSTGVVAVGWYDTSSDPDSLKVFFTVATSADGGVTFSKPQQIAEENSTPPLGRAKGPGDAPRMVFSNRALHALWADNSSLRLENNDEGEYEIATHTLGVIDVAPARVQIRPNPIAAVKGADFNGTVATFTVADATRELDDFSASIEWGDGASSDGAISQPGGIGTPFTVTGNHVYADVGAYPVWVTVTDAATGLKTGAVSNVTALQGSQTENSIAIDPSNPNRVFAVSNDNSGRSASGMAVAASNDGGVTWISGFIGDGGDALPLSHGDPKAAYDQFGNLFVTYLSNTSIRGVVVLLSENNGLDFRVLTVFQDATDSADQPSVSVGPGRNGAGGSIWLTWERGGSPFQVIMAAGADVYGLGAVGGFQEHYVAPLLGDGMFRNFGDIAIGPEGEVVLSYARGIAGAPGTGPSQIVTQTDPDGLGPLPFGFEVVVTDTNIGANSAIAAQARRSIDAEGSLAWDRSGGVHNGRLYLVYTDARGPMNGLGFFTDTQILLRYSEDAGLSWSEPIDVTDFDSTSAFLPAVAVDQSSGNVAVSWYTALGDEQQHTRYTATLSDDGGITWNRIAVFVAPGLSDASASTLDINGFGNQYGDYTGLAFVGGILQPIWADNSLELPGNPDPQRFDAANARIAIAQVTRAPLVVSSIDINDVEGDEFTLRLATFSDPEGSGVVSAYAAKINWGDGTEKSEGIIQLEEDGSFTVLGTHEYQKFGHYAVSIAITGPQTQGVANITAVIDNALLYLSFGEGEADLRVVRETEFTKVLAKLWDFNHNSKASDFDATIEWGDGSFSEGTIELTQAGSGPGDFNTFSISGKHSYFLEQSFAVTVSIREKATGEKQDRSGAIVSGDPSLEVQPGLFLDIQALQGINTGDLVLVTFTVPDDIDVALQTGLGEYRATINWGDGQVDENIIPFVTSEDVTVTGRHTYLTAGEYFPTVSVQDDSGGIYYVPLIAMVEPDVTTQVRATGSGLVYNPASDRFVGDLTISNISTTDISGPLYVVIHGLPEGVSLDSFTAIDGEGNPLYKVDQSRLSVGASLPTIALEFSNPNRVPISYTVQIFDGLRPEAASGAGLVFEPNRGQANAAVSYIARGQGYAIGLSAGQASLVLQGSPTQAGAAALMQIVGANASPVAVAIDPQSGVSNYFSGDTAITNVAHFGRVSYREVYSGVDLEYYGKDGLLEYDWIVHPGANADTIALRFGGIDSMILDSAGNLRLRINGSELVQRAPVAYQIVGGIRQQVAASYELRADGTIGFTIGAYDHSVALVIDPVLVYSTYLGGSGFELAKSVAVDAAGNTYVTGETGSSDFFTVKPFDPELNQPDTLHLSFDSFVTKFDANGVLVYSSYLGGGSSGSGLPLRETTANAITVDSAGHAWVAGYTASQLFPITASTPDAFLPWTSPGVTEGAFLTELTADGSSILYSSVFSGPHNFSNIAVDNTGKVYATTFSGLVLKFDPGTNIASYVTYIGPGITRGIAVDDLGQAYLTGFTNEPNFPTKNAIFPILRTPPVIDDPRLRGSDGFVVKLFADGQVAFSTFLVGGSAGSAGYDIALDPNRVIYVVGTTGSNDLPVPGGLDASLGGLGDGFLIKLANDGSSVLYGTYIGGSGNDSVTGVGVDAFGRAYLSGITDSQDLPTVRAHQPAFGADSFFPSDGFAASIATDGQSFDYLTYLGGSGFDQLQGVAVDAAGNASYVGSTNSTDLLTRNPAQAHLFGTSGYTDGFIVRLLAGDAGAITLHNSPFTTVEGTQYDGLVAFFETNGSETADQFSATIAWGDGLTSAGTIGGDFRNGFQIFGSHLYPDVGSHDVFVTLHDSLGRIVTATSASASTAKAEGRVHYHIAIDTAALSGTQGQLSFQFNPGAIPGSPDAEARVTAVNLFGGVAGGSTLVGAASQTSSSEFTLRPTDALNRLVEQVTLGTRIEFDLELVGPGLSQPHFSNFADVFAVQLLGANGDVSLLNSDASASLLRVNLLPDASVQARATGAAVTVAASGRATVANAPINLTITPFTIQEGLEFTVPVATFTNGNPLEKAGEFTATINWGDGSPVTSGVISGSNGQFTVSGSHAYHTVGFYPLVVTVIDPDGLAVSASTGRTVLAATTFKNNWGGNFSSESPPVSGDFNGDGILDVVVGDYSPVPTNTDRGVAILLGQGDGSFALAGFQVTGQSAIKLAVADFNNDGKLDVAAAISKFGETTVELLLGNGDGTLQSSTKLTELRNPGNIVAADFNHDGQIDLAYTQSDAPAQNSGSSSLKVALGNGNGTFQTPTTTAMTFGFHSVYADDMNGDGVSDLVLASANFQGTTNLQFLRGLGDGSFDTPILIANGKYARNSLAFEDFNGDGKQDIAAVDGVNLNIFSGNGDGSFATPLKIAASGSYSVVAGDFNGDGRPDLATGEGALQSDLGRVHIFLNEGAGSFAAGAGYEGVSFPSNLVTGDFDRDGHIDLATAGSTTVISVLPGFGDGTFASAVRYKTGLSQPGNLLTPQGVATSDVNGDTHTDAVIIMSDGKIVTELGQGDGSFQAIVSGNVGSRLKPLLIDVNNDGKLDVVAPSRDSGIGIVLGSGDGTFPTSQVNSPTGGTGAVVLADFNQDGRLDMASTNSNVFGNRTVNVSLAKADGTFQNSVQYPTGAVGGAELSIVTGDFNNDARLDLAVANYGGTLSVFLGNVDGTFGAALNTVVGIFPFNTGISPQSVKIGDFNGDGKLDMVAVGYSGTGLLLLGNGDGTFATPQTFTTNVTSRDMAVGDFNGDGKLDIVTAEESGETFSARAGRGGLSVLLGNGNGTFQHAVDYFAGLNPMSVTLGDFNQDGRLDIAAANLNSGNLSILIGNVDGTFQTAVNYTTTGFHPYGIAAGDLNGDGKLDLAVLNQSSDTAILLGNGNGTFQRPLNYFTEVGTPVFSFGAVAIGDLNGDGRADVVSGNNVLFGNGDGTFPNRRLFTYLPPVINVDIGHTSSPQDIAAGDLNGDGNIDLAVSMQGTTAILFGNGNGSFQPPILLAPTLATGLGSTSNRVRMVDMDGDGDLDLVTLHQNLAQGGGAVAVWRNNGSGGFSTALVRNVPMPKYDFFGTGLDMEIGDLNGDGHVDVVVADSGDNSAFGTVTGGVNVMLGIGDGSLAQPVHYLLPPRQTAYRVTLADLNKDGRPEIAVLTSPFGFDQARSAVALFMNNGNGGFGPAQLFDHGLSAAAFLAAGDFNSDGAADIIIPDNSNYGSVFSIIYAGNGPILVTDAPVTVTGTNLNPIVGLAFTAQVATFTDANPFSNVGDFSATINWGDGQVSTGSIRVNPLGGFEVLGSHVYASSQVFTTVVTVRETGEGTYIANATVRVSATDQALTATGVDFNAKQNLPFTGSVATFIDANPNGSIGDFTASIAWGDGQTSAGAIATGIGGGFTVIGTHTYTSPGALPVRVVIADIGGSNAAAQAQATTLEATNLPPVAVADHFVLNEDEPKLLDVLGNDTNTDGNPLTAVLVDAPIHGSVTNNVDGNFTYTPTLNFNGTDSFTYKANNGVLDSNVITVSITVKPVNDAPIAGNEVYVINEDGVLTVVVNGVQGNDTDVDGDSLNALLVSGPAHGSLSLNTNGSFSYTPVANFNGADSFTYKVNDGQLDSNVATVSITVNSVNDAPVGASLSIATLEDTPYTFKASDFGFIDTNDNPGNILQALNITSLPAAGVLSLNDQVVVAGLSIATADIGSLIFTPAANASGAGFASFQFRLQDNGGKANGGIDTSAIYTLTINVTPVNDPPVAVDDAVMMAEDTSVVIAVVSNDQDIDSASLTPTLVQGPVHGALVLNVDQSFTYTPTANYFGSDSFTYRVNDGQVDSNLATVQITVTPINDTPVMNLLSRVDVQEGQQLELQAVAHDVDTGDGLTYSLDADPAGAYIDPTTGLITWQAADGDAEYGFTVRAMDKAGAFALDSFTVHVSNVAPLLTMTGNDHSYTGENYMLSLSHSDPGIDSITGWQVNWGDGVIDTISGDPTQVNHIYHGISGPVQIVAQATDEDGLYRLNPLTLEVVAAPLQVKQLAYDNNGFVVRFNDSFDQSVINLYDSALVGLGVADVNLVGATSGVVKGSLVFDADSQGFRFLKTGGSLVADSYALTLKSGVKAFHSAQSNLDGNSDYVPGDDFVFRFTILQPGTVKLSLPDFLRGPGQDVNVTAETSLGIPLQLTSAGDIHSLSFVLNYDPTLLHVSAVTQGKGFPNGAILTTTLLQPGQLKVQVQASSLIPAGILNLLNLVADVPATAPYFATEVMHMGSVKVNGLDIVGANDDALHVVGYLGDVNGTQQLEKEDVTLIQRVALRVDSGFAAWKNLDPLMIADIDNNKFITSLDATRVYQELTNNDRPEIPPIPSAATLSSLKSKLLENPTGTNPLNLGPQIDLGGWYLVEQFSPVDTNSKKDWRKKFVTNLDGNKNITSTNQTFRIVLDESTPPTV